MIRRRQFIAGLGSAAAWPVAVRAQQPTQVRRIGILLGRAPIAEKQDAAFKKGLAELGWTESRNIRFDQRSAGGNTETLPVYAAELARLAPDAIFVIGDPFLRAMRRATSDIPIVFANVTDPVGQGFVSSLARPGGNITGFANAEFGFATKMLDLLKKLAPAINRVAFLYNPEQPAAAGNWDVIEVAAPSLTLRAAKAPVRTADDIERAITALASEPNGGLFVQAGPVTLLNHELIVALALRHRLPTVYPFRNNVESGGLASYEPDKIDMSRRAASYVDRILKGEKPRDLPVQLPTKFEMVINLKTAKALGLTIPETLLATADEVIQ